MKSYEIKKYVQKHKKNKTFDFDNYDNTMILLQYHPLSPHFRYSTLYLFPITN